ncbi:MAG: hypothetical protein IJX56_05040, partial [Alistipes sp.]|nr:hypothetical protein [Alistipes sp.]
MKKIFRMLLATALFAGVVGCSADRTEDVVLPTLTDTEDFTAVLADESRTELGADNSVLWSATDKISIFRKTVLNREYAVKAGAGTTEATFKYVAYHGSDFTKTANAVNYGVYPFAAANALSTAGVATVTIPAEQEYTPGEALLNNSVMVGKSETTTIAFKNTESMLRFRLFSEIPGDFSIRKIRLESLSGKLLNGEATVDIEAADPVLTVTSGTSALTVNVEETVLTDVETVVYAVLPATAFDANDLKITFTAYNNLDAVEGTFEVTLPSALTLERGQITTLKYTFRAEEFKGTTESWGELTWDGTSLKAVDPVGDVYT